MGSSIPDLLHQAWLADLFSFPRLWATGWRDSQDTAPQQQSCPQNTRLLNKYWLLLHVFWCLNFQVNLGSLFQASPCKRAAGKLTSGKDEKKKKAQRFSLIHKSVRKITSYHKAIKPWEPARGGLLLDIAWDGSLRTFRWPWFFLCIKSKPLT